jgi:hypothetical protein
MSSRMKAKTTLYILLLDVTWIVRTSYERCRCVSGQPKSATSRSQFCFSATARSRMWNFGIRFCRLVQRSVVTAARNYVITARSNSRWSRITYNNLRTFNERPSGCNKVRNSYYIIPRTDIYVIYFLLFTNSILTRDLMRKISEIFYRTSILHEIKLFLSNW